MELFCPLKRAAKRDLEEVKQAAHFGITWDGFFIKNSYNGGRVEITSDNDFRVLQTVDNIDKEFKGLVEAFAFEFQEVGGTKEAFFHFQFLRIFAGRRDGRFGRKFADGDRRNFVTPFQ